MKQLKRTTASRIFVALLVALPLTQFFIFYITVNINSIFLAFKDYQLDGSFKWVGFDNFKQLFSDFGKLTLYKVAFKNSLTAFLVGTVISLTITLLFSYYIYKINSKKSKMFKIILFMPSVIPAIAMATMFMQFTDSAIPKFMKMVFDIDMKGFLQNPKTIFGTIIFYNIWIGFGVNMLLFLNAMMNIPESVVDAAKLDGAGFFTELFKITLPQIFGTMQTLIIVALGSIFTNQLSIVSFFGTTSEEAYFTIGYYLYKETIGITLGNSYAGLSKLSAFGLMLTAVTVILVFTANWLMKKFGPSME